MKCKSCKSDIEVDTKNFYLINGIGFFKCKKCSKLNEDDSIDVRTIEKVYWK